MSGAEGGDTLRGAPVYGAGKDGGGGEPGDSGGTRADPAGDREHRHGLHRAHAQVSRVPGLPTGGHERDRGAGSFGAVCLASRPHGQRRPRPSESRASDLHPWRGGSPSAAPKWVPFAIAVLHSPVTPKAPPASPRAGQLSFSLRGYPGAGQLERAGQIVAFITSSPEDITPFPPSCPRQKSCSSDKVEFFPMVCCTEIKLLPPSDHNHFSEMSS